MKDDYGHDKTNKILADLEENLKEIYQESYNEIKKRLKLVDEILAEYKDSMTEKQREQLWRKQQRLTILLNDLSKDIQDVNKTAVAMINDKMLNVFEVNSNYANYFLEKESGYQLNFNLYNKEAIKKLLLDNENPFSKIAIDNVEDIKRIKKQFKKEFAKSIRLGESIQDIAKRVQKVVNRNMNDSVRIARTETTRIESVGRQETFKKGQEMGLKLKKVWISTTDARTRESHLRLMLKKVDMNDRFPNGLLYPGDYSGTAAEVCNCRCSHIVEFEGVKKSANLEKLDQDIKDLTYQEWERRKQDVS